MVKIGTLSLSRMRMKTYWDVITPLLGSTPAMRKLRERALPKETKESAEHYKQRLGRAYLYNAYRDTVDKVATKPFTQPVDVTPITGQLSVFENNCDRQGTKLGGYLFNQLKHAIAYGISFGLCDMPGKAHDEAGNPIRLSVAEAEKRNIRPYFTFIHPENLISARQAVDDQGSSSLAEFRWFDSVIKVDGNYKEHQIPMVRRMFADGRWETYLPTEIQGEDGEYLDFSNLDRTDIEYTLHKQGTHEFKGVPVEALYTGKIGEFEAEPPMMDLAYLNWAHWQSYASQRNMLHYVRIPILFGAGWDADKVDTGITLASNRAQLTTNAKATLGFVETEGGALRAGASDLEKLEDQMQVHGLAPFVTKKTHISATSRSSDDSHSHNSAERWARNTEDFAVKLYRDAGEWINQKVPEQFKVDLAEVVKPGEFPDGDATQLETMYDKGHISAKLYFRELRRRGFFSDTINIEEEIAEIKKRKASKPPESLNDPTN